MARPTPSLYRSDDRELAISKKKAFDILYGTARARLVNLSEQLDTDTAALSAQIARGITTLGELVQRQIASD